jgi:transcriptional regulator with XRE-family HTH domain
MISTTILFSILLRISNLLLPQSAALLRTARLNAGLSQRALAQRAGTTQAAVARIELGASSPTWATLHRLIRAAGSEIIATLETTVDLDPSLLDDIPRILRMTPEQRLLEVAQVSRFVAEARRV